MTTRLWWAAVVSSTLLAASGCGEVESCKKFDPGCLEGPADALTGECKFGLVRNSQDICVEKSGSDGPVDDNCGCAAGSLCNDLRQCVDVCTLPSNLPTLKPVPTKCRPSSDPKDNEAPYDFAKAAAAACTQECVRRADYCGSRCDPAVDCAPGSAQMLLGMASICPLRDPECAMRACEAARDRPCAQYSCGMAGATPNCAGVSCTNNCPSGSPDFVNDGVCDDGDLSNAISAVCRWGTDCGDCGPRRGAEPPFDLGMGDLCVDPIQCGGDTEDVRRATGWCVRFDLGAEVLRCVPDCSTRNSCPSGFDCEDLVYEENGVSMPLRDDSNQIARACFPSLMCGN
jgi:hypothetical protein